MRTTRTYVTLELSKQAFTEIETKLREADYDHCFDKQDGETVIDLTGLAVKRIYDAETNDL